MSAAILAAVVLLVIIVAAAVYAARRKAGCTADADCPSGQACIGGTCQPTGTCQPACVAPQVCVSGTCVTPSGTCQPACVAPQVCVGGLCQTPATSCYSWASYQPAAKQLPTGIVGYTPGSEMLVPVGAQAGTGQPWYLGGTNANTSDPMWGDFVGGTAPEFAPAQMWYLAAAPGCGPPAQTTDPAKAVAFNGVPVCWDFTGVSGVFTGYDAGSGQCDPWAGMGTFSLVADQMQKSQK